jgi:hypothetical protein
MNEPHIQTPSQETYHACQQACIDLLRIPSPFTVPVQMAAIQTVLTRYFKAAEKSIGPLRAAELRRKLMDQLAESLEN